MKCSFLVLILILLSFKSFAQVPASFVYQGQITKTGGIPLEANPVVFNVRIYSPVNDCLMYEEQHSINMLGSEGAFSLNIGAGIRSGTDYEDTSSIIDIFKNGINHAGITTCAADSNYNALSGHTRKVRIGYNDGSGSVTLAQDFHLQTVPYAWYANSLQGLTATNFVQINPGQNITQTNLENLLGGTNYNTLYNLASGTATSPLSLNNQQIKNLADPTLAQDAATKNYADSKIAGANIDVSGVGAGVGNGRVLSWNATLNRWEAITPAAISDSTKLPLAGGTMAGTINMNGNQLLNSGHITLQNLSTVTLGKFSNAQETTLVGTLAVGNKGATWYNSDTDKIMYWDGNSAEAVGSGSGTGDIEAIVTNAGSALSGGATSGTATLAVVTDGTTIETNGTNQLQVRDGGISTAKLAADSVESTKVLDGTLVNADINASAAIAWSKINKTGANAADVGAVAPARAINTNTGSGLTGGGDLSADRNLAINTDNSSLEISTNTLRVKDSGITSAKINSVSVTKITSAAAEYFSYMPAGTECTNNYTLLWDAVNDRWVCGALPSSFASVADTDNDTKIQVEESADEDKIRFDTAGVERMVIDELGRVGIGTPSPSNALSFSGNSANSIAMERHSVADTAGNNLTVRAGGATSGATNRSGGNLILSSGVSTGNASSNIQFQTNSGFMSGTSNNTPFTTMTISGAGNVGIGWNLTNPSRRLEITGLSSSGYVPNNAFASPVLNNPATVRIGGPTPMAGDGYASYLEFTTANTAGNMQTGYIANISTTGAGSYSPSLAFGHQNGSSSYTERMRIDSSGNIGIGTTSPASKLDVEGTLQVSDGGETCSTAANAGMIKYAAGTLQYCNGSAWQSLGVSGAGLTSLGGQTGSTQTFASGTSGNSPAITSAGNIHTLNIPLASASGVTSGTISKTEYDAFTAKLGAVTGSPLTSARIWVGDVANAAQPVDITGDATLSNTGALTIAANAITSSKINDGSVALADLAGDSVDSSKIVDGTIATADIGNSQVTDAKINTVSVNKITSAATQYFSYMPAGTECNPNEVLKWDAVTDRWICGVDDNTGAVSSVFSRTGAVVSQNGDYTASQITNVAAGNIATTTAQAALNELDSEKVAKAGDTMTGTLNLPGNGLVVGTNQLVVASGNVGIGTATASDKLVVNGNVLALSGGISSGTAGGGYRATLSNPGAGHGRLTLTNNAAVDTVVLDAGGSSYLTGGNVGIGTTVPGSALDISGAMTMRGIAAPTASSAGQGRIYFDSTSNKFRVSQNGGSYADLLGSGGGTPAGANQQIQFNNSGAFGANSGFTFDGTQNMMTIYQPNLLQYAKVHLQHDDGSGDVGQTTYRSDGLLTTYGGNNYGSMSLFPDYLSLTTKTVVGASRPLLRTRTASSSGGYVTSGSRMGGLVFSDFNETADVGSGVRAVATENHSVSAKGTDLIFGTIANTSATVSDRMVIRHDGNVGIGTPSPLALLHLDNGNTGGENFRSFRHVGSNNWSNISRYYQSRGTASAPTSTVNGDFLVSFNMGGYDGSSYQDSTSFAAVTDGAISSGVVPGAFVFYTGSSGGGSERMRISSAGNVGIGTTVPDAKLDVAGAIVSRVHNNVAGTSFDFSFGNTQYTSANCGAFTLSNMKDGGVYQIIVKGTTVGTCSFTHAGLTIRLPSGHGPTISGKHTIYSFVRAGVDVYVSWLSDY